MKTRLLKWVAGLLSGTIFFSPACQVVEERINDLDVDKEISDDSHDDTRLVSLESSLSEDEKNFVLMLHKIFREMPNCSNAF